MGRILLPILAIAVVGYSALLAGAFLVHALEVLDRIPPVIRGGTLLADLGLAIGAVIASLGVVLAAVRYLVVPRGLWDLARRAPRE